MLQVILDTAVAPDSGPESFKIHFRWTVLYIAGKVDPDVGDEVVCQSFHYKSYQICSIHGRSVVRSPRSYLRPPLQSPTRLLVLHYSARSISVQANEDYLPHEYCSFTLRQYRTISTTLHMPIKIPKGFQRRKSAGNDLDELPTPPEPSFKVFERPQSTKSFDGGNNLKRRSVARPLSAGQFEDERSSVGVRPDPNLTNRYVIR